MSTKSKTSEYAGDEDIAHMWSYYLDWAERNRSEILATYREQMERDEPEQDYCHECGASPWDCTCTYSPLSRVGD